jgi:hypothetical protein
MIALCSRTALFAGCARQPDPPVGTWRSSVRFESGAFAEFRDLEFMYVFNAGGTAKGSAVRIGT